MTLTTPLAQPCIEIRFHSGFWLQMQHSSEHFKSSQKKKTERELGVQIIFKIHFLPFHIWQPECAIHTSNICFWNSVIDACSKWATVWKPFFFNETASLFHWAWCLFASPLAPGTPFFMDYAPCWGVAGGWWLFFISFWLEKKTDEWIFTAAQHVNLRVGCRLQSHCWDVCKIEPQPFYFKFYTCWHEYTSSYPISTPVSLFIAKNKLKLMCVSDALTKVVLQSTSSRISLSWNDSSNQAFVSLRWEEDSHPSQRNISYLSWWSRLSCPWLCCPFSLLMFRAPNMQVWQWKLFWNKHPSFYHVLI